ncbi:hypothetical protein SVAN01_08772 [Stagonosporopsis vannaccii]|nr:hypothetical protein SVAN01_08772 [Stagonosporopsis vannaccii]
MAPKNKPLPVREQITYPVVHVTAENDPCRSQHVQLHHALLCGHLITTLKPDEPCAPNCSRVAVAKAARTSRQTNSKTCSDLLFYCDACVESTNEPQVASTLSNEEAERKRAALRLQEATRQDKANKYRRCYIAQKTVSVPCDEDGHVVGNYSPVLRRHPFDTALPRSGANMFEDVDVPPHRKNSTRQAPYRKSTPLILASDDEEEGEEEDQEDEISEDIDDTVAEGIRWVQGDRARLRRKDPRSMQRLRAARPIINSSPDTDLSSFISNTSGPSPAQARAQTAAGPMLISAIRVPGTKRKKMTQKDETAQPPCPLKR